VAARRDFVRENNDLPIIRRCAVRPFPTIVLFIVHVIVFIVPPDARASPLFFVPFAAVFQKGDEKCSEDKLLNEGPPDYFRLHTALLIAVINSPLIRESRA